MTFHIRYLTFWLALVHSGCATLSEPVSVSEKVDDFFLNDFQRSEILGFLDEDPAVFSNLPESAANSQNFRDLKSWISTVPEPQTIVATIEMFVEERRYPEVAVLVAASLAHEERMAISRSFGGMVDSHPNDKFLEQIRRRTRVDPVDIESI